MRNLGPDSTISVVAPLYNEIKGINEFVEELQTELEKLGYGDRYELVLVNDGSTDGTDKKLDLLRQGTPARSRPYTSPETSAMLRLFPPV